MKRAHLEDDACIALMRWKQLNMKRLPELDMLFHVPNGGTRAVREAARFKRMGVQPGVPDYFLDVPRGAFHGLRIEMKSPTGKVSDEQKDWLYRLNKHGYCAVVCYGWEDAAKMIESYLK